MPTPREDGLSGTGGVRNVARESFSREPEVRGAEARGTADRIAAAVQRAVDRSLGRASGTVTLFSGMTAPHVRAALADRGGLEDTLELRSCGQSPAIGGGVFSPAGLSCDSEPGPFVCEV